MAWLARISAAACALALFGACSLTSLDDLKENANVDAGSAGQAGSDGGNGCSASCIGLAAECGDIADPCGGVLSCGSCTGDDFCGGGGPYNPLSWSGVVLDAKGGEQGAVSVISYVNEVYVPGYCAEPHRGSAMYEFAKYFDNHHLIGVCAEDLVEPFVDAVDEVAAYCDAPR